jgi:uncharacterized protein (TIGR00251 family)
MDAEDIAAILDELPQGTIVPCWIQPRSSRNQLYGIHDNALKIALTAPPVDGKANAELIKFLAKKMGVPKSSVEIVAGETSRKKILRVNGVFKHAVADRLAI